MLNIGKILYVIVLSSGWLLQIYIRSHLVKFFIQKHHMDSHEKIGYEINIRILTVSSQFYKKVLNQKYNCDFLKLTNLNIFS